MASRPLGVVAGLESPNSPHCLDLVSIPNTSKRPAIYGCSIPPPGQPDSAWARTTWLAACCPCTTQRCDQGTHASHIGYHTGWAVAFPALPAALGRNGHGGDRGAAPSPSTLASSRVSLRISRFLTGRGQGYRDDTHHPLLSAVVRTLESD